MADTHGHAPSPKSHTGQSSARSLATSVCVIIPTFRRCEGLQTALMSVRAQTGLESVTLSVIVCDNSPEASARTQVAAFAALANFPVQYIHEPATGVANARNSAVAACTTQLIAFLDDDEEAPAHWLSKLLATQQRFKADVVFGPVTARLPKPDLTHDGYLERFFSRFGPERSGILTHYYGCGNSLIRRDRLPTEQAPFSVAHNNMGGEDDQLFNSLMVGGAVMAWAADAPVFEDVPTKRASLKYTLRRAFAYGQGPSYTAAQMHRPFVSLAWMIQGSLQAILFGLWGTGLSLVRHPSSAARLDKAARGLGKLLWFPPFKIGFYGTALLKTKHTKKKHS